MKRTNRKLTMFFVPKKDPRYLVESYWENGKSKHRRHANVYCWQPKDREKIRLLFNELREAEEKAADKNNTRWYRRLNLGKAGKLRERIEKLKISASAKSAGKRQERDRRQRPMLRHEKPVRLRPPPNPYDFLSRVHVRSAEKAKELAANLQAFRDMEFFGDFSTLKARRPQLHFELVEKFTAALQKLDEEKQQLAVALKEMEAS